MVIEIIYKDDEGKIKKRNIKNIWELQDNDGKILVVKEHNHLCEHFKFEDIKELKIYRGGD
jgi:hypothetical protein